MQRKKFFPKNKAIVTILVIFFSIVAAGVAGHFTIQDRIKNWEDTNKESIAHIQTTAEKIILSYQSELLHKKNSLKKKLDNINPAFSSIHRVLSKENVNDLIAAIYVEDQIYYWNENVVDPLFFQSIISSEYDDLFFLKTDVSIYLGIKDSIILKGLIYDIYLLEIIEKNYQLNDEYFNEVSLSKEISTKTSVSFEISYSKLSAKTKDGRKHSFYINNNKGNKIGTATFIKPSQTAAVNEIENYTFIIQSMLAILGYLIIGYYTIRYIYHTFGKPILATSVILILGVLRYLLIFIDFPRNIIATKLFDPQYYYSQFGNGIAASPMDIFITILFFAVIFYLLFHFSLNYYHSKSFQSPLRSIYLVITIVIGILFYLTALRGTGAAFRGFVFDSSIRYFQSNLLSISLPNLVMQINVFLLGLVSIIGSVVILLFVLIISRQKNKRNKFLLTLIPLIIISEIIYSYFQQDPQLNLLLKLMQICFVFTLLYIIINYDINRINKVIIFFIAASIFSISSILFYNSELEKASLKTTAEIISHLDDDVWYKQLINETLIDDFSRKEAAEAFSKEKANFNSSAFKIWSKSQLQKEAVNSSVNFLSLSGQLLGGFGSIYPRLTIDEFIDTNSVIEEIQIFEEPTELETQKLIRGIFPVKDQYAFLGYLDVSILYDLNDFGFSSHPEFISTGKLNEKAILKLDKLIILDYRSSELKIVYGNLNPTQKLNETILTANFTEKNDAWINTEINNSEYIIYTRKVLFNNFERIIAVALRDKELTIELFDFFKIFFTHSLLLLMVVFIYFMLYYRTKFKYQLDLRAKLLIAFLIISLLPLILTALFFRNLTDEKNTDAIYYKLGKRAFSIENYLNDNFIEYGNENIFIKASNDLNINFTIYRDNYISFSSDDLLYDVGLLPKILNPIAYGELNIENSQEVLVPETIDRYKFNAFYYKADLLGSEIIIKVTDAFNQILLPLSGSEVDVFLFGFYSLAVVLIILFSALFANQISLPIRKITSATKSVAAGDLSPEIKTNAKGELGELVAGFQFMLRELKKNQSTLAEIEREEAWKEMAKQVAHEIKNPLTPMKLSVQQLITAYNDNSEKFDQFFPKVTGTILNQIETLKNIATEFSHFARMPKLKLEEINCVDVINQSVNLFTDENIKIVFNAELEQAIIMGDSEQLKRTIINLIRNSIQANATIIKLDLQVVNNIITLRIEDNGVGISSEEFDKVFEPNFTTKTDGMGLGLSMARRYLRSTGGDILVEYSSEKGTTFKLTFPK